MDTTTSSTPSRSLHRRRSALAATAALSATALVAPAAHAATGTYTYTRQWSVTSGVWSPTAVAVSPGGTVTVAVKLGSLSGPTTIRTYSWAGALRGSFEVPTGEVTDIAYDRSGNIHVAVVRAPYGEVQVRRPSGSLLRTYARTTPGITYNMPDDLAIDSTGSVAVVYGSSHRVVRYSSSGQYIRALGRYGSGKGRLNRPSSVTVGAGNSLVVVDAGNDRIQEFSRYGSPIRTFGRSGSGRGQFVMPRDAEVSPSGSTFVTDATRRVQEFDRYGRYRRTVPQSALRDNTDIAFSSTGTLYVAGYHASLKRGIASFSRR